MKIKIIAKKNIDFDDKKSKFFHVNVAKKTAKLAITRNKIKRRMRDIIKSCFIPKDKNKIYIFNSFSIDDIGKNFKDLKNSVLNLIKNYK